MATEIHPSSVVSEGAQIDEDVKIGPFCVVGPEVKLGRGTKLISHVTVDGDTTLGEENEVYPYAALGMLPQDIKHKDEKTSLVIGSRNTIRESVTMHLASVGGDGVTTVGDDNLFMVYAHVGHDSKIGSNAMIGAYVAIAGHVVIEDFVVAGGMLAIHQHVRIGAYAMLGGVSRIINDVPPYVIASGADKAKLFGLNLVGLRRGGFTREEITELKEAYRLLFREKLSLSEAIKKIQEELPYTDKIKHLVEFVQANKRGLCR